ncbi:MAG: cytochrome [Actinomycetia bacterium]|nr:cytochrome [Actinomycetes bacterium]
MTDLAALVEQLDDPAFYADDPFPVYAELRAHDPLARHPGGFRIVSRHTDVLRISRDPEAFCSGRGILLMDIGRELPDTPGALLYVDPPQHTRYRELVNPSFTGARVRALESWVRDLARGLIERIDPGTPIDIVEHVTVPFPLLVIAELLGVPAEDRDRFQAWSDAMIRATNEPGGVPDDDSSWQLGEFVNYLLEVFVDRRAHPRPDLVTELIGATVDGERLDDGELLMFCIQLLVAGNETTRNLLSAGLLAFAASPKQWDRLREDPALVPSAAEELLRYTSPVISFMRTATRPVEVGGIPIEEGEHLLLLYASANRDEAVFGPTAERFDVGRHPNHHVGFGFGAHFCLGAALARLETRVFLEELLARFVRIEVAGPVIRTPSTVIAGVTRAELVLSA